MEHKKKKDIYNAIKEYPFVKEILPYKAHLDDTPAKKDEEPLPNPAVAGAPAEKPADEEPVERDLKGKTIEWQTSVPGMTNTGTVIKDEGDTVMIRPLGSSEPVTIKKSDIKNVSESFSNTTKLSKLSTLLSEHLANQSNNR